MKNKRKQALKISAETYNKVYERDGNCVLCKILGEHPKVKLAKEKGLPVLYQCHHFIPKSRLGMGIEENLVMLCYYHHAEEAKYRKELENYLKNKYENWNEEDLIFKKE